MSDLPDLNTSGISFIAYWNAIDDGGVNSIDPETALTNPNIVSYTVYDNGVEITFDATPSRNCQARIKTDGWMMAYLTGSTSYGSADSGEDTTNIPTGWYDIVGDWNGGGERPGGGRVPSLSMLENVIQSLAGSLDKSSGITFSQTDVEYYNYDYPSADAVTMMASEVIYDNATSKTSSFSYSASTDILAAALLTSIESTFNNTVYFDGPDISRTQVNGEYEAWAATDLQGSGLIPSDSTDYSVELYSPDDSYYTQGTVAIIWASS